MATTPVSKSIHHNSKPSSKPVLIAEYSCKQDKGFSIVIPTRIKKQEKHYVYGDRVEKVLNEIHEYYQGPNKKQKVTESVATEGKLIKTIKLPLGDKKNLLNDKYLINQVFPKMTALRLTQNEVQKNKYLQKIFLQVKWKGSPKIQTVRVSYMKEYQPEVLAEYNCMRMRYQEMWKKYLKRFDWKERKELNNALMEKGQSQEVSQERPSVNKEEVSEKKGSEKYSENYILQESIGIDSTDDIKPDKITLKRNASSSMEKSYQQTEMKRKFLKQQNDPIEQIKETIEISFEQKPHESRRTSFFTKSPSFMDSILDKHKNLRTVLEKSGVLPKSNPQMFRHKSISFSNDSISDSEMKIKTETDEKNQEKPRTLYHSNNLINRPNISQPKTPIVIEIDDD